jgi:hypothetical protein
MHFSLILLAATTVTALGINCQGSSQCSQGSGEVSRKLTTYINQIDSNLWIADGTQVACVRVSYHLFH